MDRDNIKKRLFKYSYFVLLVIFALCMYKSHHYGYFEIERAIYGSLGYAALAVIGFVMGFFPEFAASAMKRDAGARAQEDKVTMARRVGLLILMICAVQIVSRWT